MERQESDPDTLENLFRLDHLATRMRRNAENLLVLAGEQTPRRWGKPIAVRDVVRAAAAEIADYRRVKLGDIDGATVSGNLATDLSHLVAELLENAGSFSPPNTNIEVLGQLTNSHYRLAVVDHGIGMDERAMAEANDRLKNPVDFADAPSAYLGLFVVGRLSQDLGITVRLTSADPTGEGKHRGTIAFIDLPVHLLSTEQPNTIEVTARTEEAAAATPAVTEEQVFESPTLTPATPLNEPAAPTPAAVPLAPQEPVGTTSAGFPQRRGRKSGNDASQASEPQPTSPADPEPVVAQASAPPVAPVPEAPPAAVPTAPDAGAVTSAGFPKRRSKNTPDPGPAAAPSAASADENAPAIQRDASQVSSSLRSFRAAVARGRQAGQAQTPVAPGAPTPNPPTTVTPPATRGAPDTASLPQVPSAPAPTAPKMAPPVVGTATAPALDVPNVSAPESPAEVPASETPTTTGSES